MLEGEPGIGKSRLLDHLAGRAAAGGRPCSARARRSTRRDLPYALWTEALDRHLRRSAAVASRPEALADPASRRRAPAQPTATARTGRCATCSSGSPRRAAGASGSTTCTGPTPRRSTRSRRSCAGRPPAPVLFAVAAREGQLPAAWRCARRRASRGPRDRAALGAAERGRGDRAGRRRAAAIYAAAAATRSTSSSSRGCAARRGAAAGAATARSRRRSRPRSPPSSPRWRRTRGALLEAAAVAGDPFEPELAAAVAELPEPAALRALDELLAGALVRPAGAPRRFAFRHPVVRHAVYVATPGGWRLGAHARAAARARAPRRRAVQRAHHVEHAADAGRRGRDRAAERAAARAAGARARGRGALLRRRAAPAARRRRERRSRLQLRSPTRRPRRATPRPRATRCSTRCATAGPGERLGAHGRARQPGVVARRPRGRAPAAARRARRAARAAVGRPHPPAARAQR